MNGRLLFLDPEGAPKGNSMKHVCIIMWYNQLPYVQDGVGLRVAIKMEGGAQLQNTAHNNNNLKPKIFGLHSETYSAI